MIQMRSASEAARRASILVTEIVIGGPIARLRPAQRFVRDVALLHRNVVHSRRLLEKFEHLPLGIFHLSAYDNRVASQLAETAQSECFRSPEQIPFDFRCKPSIGVPVNAARRRRLLS